MAIETREQTAPVNTCYLVKCDKCGKTSWKGCGKHVDQCLMAVHAGDSNPHHCSLCHGVLSRCLSGLTTSFDRIIGGALLFLLPFNIRPSFLT
ncbi:hypothetical protein NEOLEDRAFT_1243429 [Neolentinus lepideus HHB14362 ss-1]|uniref:Uncharacterized protein n=1 Tax=Neolentinus lepideus HHB14362 ss-1 TaxID=1314782 RepID=A0A165QZY0_9AGAM|nr:hypothetical protein NEOLEDRAFT_1243429 [Neolentinus lepideus HHB14362 ss-1]